MQTKTDPIKVRMGIKTKITSSHQIGVITKITPSPQIGVITKMVVLTMEDQAKGVGHKHTMSPIAPNVTQESVTIAKRRAISVTTAPRRCVQIVKEQAI